MLHTDGCRWRVAGGLSMSGLGWLGLGRDGSKRGGAATRWGGGQKGWLSRECGDERRLKRDVMDLIPEDGPRLPGPREACLAAAHLHSGGVTVGGG